MNRREVVLGLGAIAAPALASAQDGAVPVVGFLSLGRDWNSINSEFLSGLRALGYEPGRSITIEPEFVGGNEGLLSAAVAALLAKNVRMIVADGRPAAAAALKFAPDVPVIASPIGDAGDFGITDLRHPGGRLTGVSMQQDDTDAKVASLLKEIVPTMSCLAVLRRVGGRTDPLLLEATSKGMTPIIFELPGRAELDRTLSEMEAAAVDGLIVVHTASFNPFIADIAGAALRARIPAASSWGSYARAGLLMAYSVDGKALSRRSASYVDRLLKGASPADLPIEQPTKFDLVLNLKTAAALGRTITPAVLARADEVIE